MGRLAWSAKLAYLFFASCRQLAQSSPENKAEASISIHTLTPSLLNSCLSSQLSRVNTLVIHITEDKDITLGAMRSSFSLFLTCVTLTLGQQECYFGPGASNRGPSSLVPCLSTGQSACCLLGDTCLSGNTCYNYKTGDLYQYGCTDITYRDATCPYKCGWSARM